MMTQARDPKQCFCDLGEGVQEEASKRMRWVRQLRKGSQEITQEEAFGRRRCKHSGRNFGKAFKALLDGSRLALGLALEGLAAPDIL